MGDADLNGRFTSEDFVAVFQAGQYEDTKKANSTWATGDWDGDLEFTSEDVVTAFIAGTYEVASPTPATNVVPEPTGLGLILLGWLMVSRTHRRHHSSAASGSRINR